MVRFTARGHPNILATHNRTFEFTKDPMCTPRGDCVVGVAANFSLEQLKPLLRNKRIEIALECDGIREIAHVDVNPAFCHPTEFVVRMGEFRSDRTFAVRADKAAADFSAEFRRALRNPDARITVTLRAE